MFIQDGGQFFFVYLSEHEAEVTGPVVEGLDDEHLSVTFALEPVTGHTFPSPGFTFAFNSPVSNSMSDGSGWDSTHDINEKDQGDESNDGNGAVNEKENNTQEKSASQESRKDFLVEFFVGTVRGDPLEEELFLKRSHPITSSRLRLVRRFGFGHREIELLNCFDEYIIQDVRYKIQAGEWVLTPLLPIVKLKLFWVRIKSGEL